MHCRSQDLERFWSSQFARPFIFVPAMYLSNSDHDGKLGISPNTDEAQKEMPSSSSASSGLPFPSQTSDPSLTGGPGHIPVEKRTGRGRLRKTRAAKGVTRAEDIPEYKGQMSVDDLVVFINNSGRTSELRKDSRKAGATRNISSKRSEQGFIETGSTSQVTSGKLAGGKNEQEKEKEKEEEKKENEKEQTKEEQTAISTRKEGFSPEDTLDPDSEVSAGIAWSDFTIVSRKRKVKSHLITENAPNAVKLNCDINGRAGRENSPTVTNLVPHVKRGTNLKGESSFNEAKLNLQVNQGSQEEDRNRKLLVSKEFQIVMCQNKSPVLNVKDSSAQRMTNSQRRKVTAVALDVSDKLIPTTYQSSENRGVTSLSSQKPSQDVQTRKQHQTIIGDDSKISGVRSSRENRIQSLSTTEIAAASCRNSKKSEGPAVKSGSLCPPVVFTDRNSSEFEKPVDISFGFDAEDDVSQTGLELGNCIGGSVTTLECSSARNGCRCNEVDVQSHEKLQYTDTHAHEAAEYTSVRSGTNGNPETKTQPSTRLLTHTTTYPHNGISGTGNADSHTSADSTKEKRTSLDTFSLQSTTHAKANANDSDRVNFVQPVNCIKSSKKSPTVPAKTKRVTNSTSKGAISTDLCATSLSSMMCRPISVVAPNQTSKLSRSLSVQSSSSVGHGSSSSVHSESSIKGEGSSQSFCSSSRGHVSPSTSSSHGSGVILGPCAKAPVVKVAPMLVEKQVSTRVTDAKAMLFITEDDSPLVNKLNSHCEESLYKDEQCCNRSAFTDEESSIREKSFLKETGKVVKLESGPCEEHVYNVHNTAELLCSREEEGCNIHKQSTDDELNCDFVKEDRNFRSRGNDFDLLSTQIYLYKAYLDSLSDLHEDNEEVPEACEEPQENELTQ